MSKVLNHYDSMIITMLHIVGLEKKRNNKGRRYFFHHQ